MNKTEQLKDASQLFCPNLDCSARGKVGAGNLVSHGKKRERYKCKTCGKTFSARQGTMLEGLRKPEELIVIVVTLLAYGCPPQAIVHALGLDERTVARWQERAGAHCQRIHEKQVMQGTLDLTHVQADEIRVKGCRMIPWMAMALMVSTRLWLGGVVSLTRDRRLADRLFQLVKACCLPLCPLLLVTDGWSAYPGSIRRAFREKVKRERGRGRCRLHAWPTVVIGTVIKTRRCRHAARKLSRLEAGMWPVGCTYNFCWPHHELSWRAAKAQDGRGEGLLTPAMASGLTDHVWSVRELLTFRIPPPAWVTPKRRGRSPTGTQADKGLRSARPVHLRPVLRLRKGRLCLSTS